MMEEICGYRIDIQVNPAFVRQSEVKILIGSPERMRALLGEINVIPLEQTLRWMAQA